MSWQENDKLELEWLSELWNLQLQRTELKIIEYFSYRNYMKIKTLRQQSKNIDFL
jgi:hypothetical protein